MADIYTPFRDHMATVHGINLSASAISDIGKILDECRAAAEALDHPSPCPICQDQEPDRNRCPECLGSGLV
jgi:hypothetical protein